MPDQVRFGDFILGLQGLAILRSWMLDLATIRARAQKILEISDDYEKAPWSNPIVVDERTVTAGYAEWAAGYDTERNPIILAEEPVVHELLSRYPRGAALDAACGTGRHAAYLAALGHEVTGIDATAEMLEKAKARVPSAQFETADLLAIPLPDGAMDCVVCTLALTHCADLGPPVQELARVVRPGGRIVISDVHPLMVLLGVHGGYRQSQTEYGVVRNHVHLASDYLTAFDKAGLKVIKCIEPLWGEREIATMGFAEQVPDLTESAVKGLPIVVVWELEKSA